MGFFYIFGTIFFTVYGQLILKWRISGFGQLPEATMDKVVFLLKLLFDPFIFSGFASAFIASLFWMAAMTKFDVSYAYPFMSLSFVLVFLFAAFFFQRCHNKYYNYPSIAYDIKDRDFKELDEEYKNVRKYKNANLESFVEKIGLIDPSDELIQSKLTSRTVLQCFVNEEGKIETVFILEHSRLGDFDLSYDMLAVHALLQSKFKPVKIDSKNVKYFIPNLSDS